MKNIVFICGAKDFHAMDKFRLTSQILSPRKIMLLTDTIQGEGQSSLIQNNDIVDYLFVIDKFTFKSQSSIINLWRNLLKIILIPVQVFYLKKFYKKNPDCIYHATPMYYMLLCYLAKVPYVGTPQGSEILIRPQRSSLYKKYAIKSLIAAKHIVVDSVIMKNEVKKLAGIEATILKNGFNTTQALSMARSINERSRILSMRGLNPIYRIQEILESRNNSIEKNNLTLVYPACEKDYRQRVIKFLISTDQNLGKLDKEKLYSIMGETILAISIPESDSSPRSVYECIFAGACVAATYSPYIDELPQCMRDRIFIVDIDDVQWFDNAVAFARNVARRAYIPSEEALNICEEKRTIKKIEEKIY